MTSSSNGADVELSPGGDDLLPAIEVVELSKCYRPRSAVELKPIPWLARRRRRPGNDKRPRGGSLIGQEDDDADDDFDDDLDLGDVGEGELDAEVDDQRPRLDREVWALRDVSFTLAPGSVLGVIGANGAGKSTLISVLQRVSPPTTGHAVTRGRVAPSYSIAANLIDGNRSGVACVFRLAKFFRVPQDVAEAAIEPIRELTELGDMLELPTRNYSTGQLSRLAFAISIGLQPDIMITDGLPSVGDPAYRNRAIAALRERIDGGLTVVLASPDTRRVRELCTEALWLKEGRVLALGAADEVASQYETEFAIEAAGRASRKQRVAAGRSDVSVNTAGVYDMSGEPVETIRATDDSLLELTIEVRQAPKRLRCVVALLTEGAIRVRLVQPSNFDAFLPGTYAASVHMPPGTVPPGTYEGKARIIELVDEERRTVDQADFELESLATGEAIHRQVSTSKLVWEVVSLSRPGPAVNGDPD